MVQLMVTRALYGDESLYTDESLDEFRGFLGLQAAEEFGDLIKTSKQDEIVFSFRSTEQIESYSTGKLDEKKLENLEQYLSFLREKLLIDEPLVLTGHVVLLKSKDPSKDRNSIELNILSGATNYSEAILSLESADYDRAIDAHHHNKIVNVVGTFKRLRRRLKCVELKEFIVHS